MEIYHRRVKRLLDLFFAALFLLIGSPFLAAISLFLLLAYRGRVFFVQERVGRYGEKFRMYKFQTMTDRQDDFGGILSDEERVTRFGRFLRDSSLDELPQLWNVLRGEMSLIGPRPLLEIHLRDCTPEEFHRHDVRPGLTGLAQVCGRNHIPFAQRFSYDLWYVRHQSFRLDCRIVWMTIRYFVTSDYQSSKDRGVEPHDR